MTMWLPSLDNTDAVRSFLQPKGVLEETSTRGGRLWTIVTAPINVVAFIGLQALALAAHYLCMPRVYYFLHSLSFQMIRNQLLFYNMWAFGERLLVPTYSVSQLGAHLLTLPANRHYGSIPDGPIRNATHEEKGLTKTIKQEIRRFFLALNAKRYLSVDWLKRRLEARVTTEFSRRYREESLFSAIDWLRDRFDGYANLESAVATLYYQIEKEREERYSNGLPTVTFMPPSGNCRGSGLWFIALLHKTIGAGIPIGGAVRAVASQFETGTPPQAQFIHAFRDLTEFLGIEMESCPNQYITAYDLDWNYQVAREKVDILEPGIYRVGCLRHSLVYVKVDGKRDFLWDSNAGLLKASSPYLLEYIRENYHAPGSYKSAIYFEKYRPKL